MEVMLLSIISPVVACQWGLLSWKEAFIATVSQCTSNVVSESVTQAVFIGFFLGGFIWGAIVDRVGRKKVCRERERKIASNYIHF